MTGRAVEVVRAPGGRDGVGWAGWAGWQDHRVTLEKFLNLAACRGNLSLIPHYCSKGSIAASMVLIQNRHQ